ncbi:MAG: hypothetical protein JOZ78_11400 [Chroococcidiopsidaceae cyanobacterium CP_BM_ER_R8_30]|nr:hypothetical protein [Chroococcidiopsidaceae cyanobacterium CP_BM_ER_R8_30]
MYAAFILTQRRLLTCLQTVTASFLLAICIMRAASAQQEKSQAPDASTVGPLATVTEDYDLGPAVNPVILPGCVPTSSYDCNTELKARIYRPQTLTGVYPLIIFLHGNHATCGRPYNPPYQDPPGFPGNPRIDDNNQYTGTGTCPVGYVEAPSYLGYAYLANRLASYGYIVVSIDANRGINAGPGLANDPALIFARGRLVLTHLQFLSECNINGSTELAACDELKGRLDFGNVGLMGHSRGGEGMRAAYNLYNAPGSAWPTLIPNRLNIKGIFEIAPTDNTNMVSGNSLDANGTAWNVLLPMCDADVSDLAGARPFDRMLQDTSESPPTQKSTYTVWGANHNFYNTEWQVSDTVTLTNPVVRFSCIGGAPNTDLFPDSPGSPNQRLTAISSLLAFFRANIGAGADATFNQNFNPLFSLPQKVTDETGASVAFPTLVNRGYSPSANSIFNLIVDNFDKPTGTSSYGIPDDVSNITINDGGVRNEDPVLSAGQITWNTPGSSVFFQTNSTDINTFGRDLTGFKTLDFRVSRQYNSLNPVGPTDFSIQLVSANGILTRPVRISNYTDLRGPVGGVFGGRHPILQTVSVPLTDFGNFNLVKNQVRGVRLIFDQTPQGAIYITDVRFLNTFGSGVPDLTQVLGGQAQGLSLPNPNSQSAQGFTGGSSNTNESTILVHHGHIVSIRTGSAMSALQNQPGVEIEVFSQDGFPVRDAKRVLQIGKHQFFLDRYKDDDMHTLIFTLTNDEFAQVATGDPVRVQYGTEPSQEWWDLGYLDKSITNQNR